MIQSSRERLEHWRKTYPEIAGVKPDVPPRAVEMYRTVRFDTFNKEITTVTHYVGLQAVLITTTPVRPMGIDQRLTIL